MSETIFTKIIQGDIPSRKAFENERIYAFHDIQPAAPVHVLIVPKKPIPSLNDIADEDLAVIGEIHRVAVQLAEELGIAESGYRVINNCGRDGGQTVPHLHFHLLGGGKLGALTGASDSHA
ncbi:MULTISPECIES: histidine triad nucleotide-binding protein [Saccharibacillus]|uniref:Histidine triad nucleotide-binding protein n=1 Tax=Saccharibacillus brassicae TaxID=2583377 RepID=A0A4Y6UUB1_SACBS|nr:MULTISPECIES: histidine triad nucleotide-binding protein [Saccharibacillus]MWJ32281.1 HIT domain-containing protein [Saccharibacillus sp. WB 17]QDH19927.1 histidine triad nucleotide-binding protein [Saccharibacillus brassicae]